MQRQPLTTGQVAKYCGVNFRTVIRWIERGQLEAFKLPGRGDNRIEVRHFLEFLKEHRMPIPPDLAASADSALVIDDDLVAAQRIEQILKGHGFDTSVAEDGFRAGVMLAAHPPGLVTLDLRSAGIKGVEVISFLRSVDQLKHTKVLVVSDLPKDRLKEARRAGADDVLAKPFPDDLLVQKALALVGKN